MPAPKFDDLVAEMEEAGVDPDFIAKAKAAFDASPLRAENKELKAAAEAAIERANKAETVALTGTFKELGITAKPTAFNLPADLDRTDREAVQGWAVEQGLIAAPEPQVPNEHLDALGRVEAAAVGAGASSSDPTAALLAAETPEEFWAQAQANGLAV